MTLKITEDICRLTFQIPIPFLDFQQYFISFDNDEIVNDKYNSLFSCTKAEAKFLDSKNLCFKYIDNINSSRKISRKAQKILSRLSENIKSQFTDT